jgi:hypothetical protein
MRVLVRSLLALAAIAMVLMAAGGAGAHHDPVHTYFQCETTAYQPWTGNGVVGGQVQIRCGSARYLRLLACLQEYIRHEGYWSDLTWTCYRQDFDNDSQRTNHINAWPSAWCSEVGLGLYRTRGHAEVFEGGRWHHQYAWSSHAWNCSGY